MAVVTLNNIEKTFGQRVLFDQLGFSIDRGERVGLIGDNGSGKSSLFRVITGQLPIDDGSVAISDGSRVAYLTQDPVFAAGNTVIDEAELAFSALHDLSHRLRELEHEMAVRTGADLDKVLNRYQDAQHEFELAGGYAWRHRLEAMLAGVGLAPESWEQDVTTLSGGQRSRLALAKLLIEPCDLLLLDEPTNHLDLAAIAWLEEFLETFPGAVLLVSHDRYLLDRLVNRIVWLTGSKLKNYPGNYSAFVEQRALQEVSQQRAYSQQQEDIAKQEEYIRRFKAGQRARQAMGRKKRLDRLMESDDVIQAVQVDRKIRVSMRTDQRAGDRVLRVKDLSKSYGERTLWAGVSLEISRGERIGILGPNAAGKTTFLEVLLGRREPDAGEVKWGANLSIGYYDQRLGEFNPDHTVTEEVRRNRAAPDGEVRAVLAMMLFRGDTVDKPVRMLSGGERARLAIAQLLLDKPNVLVMDEPTNHLDIHSCEALETALADFPGTLICVSHDRYFLDSVAERLLLLQPPDVISFDGNYSQWAARQAPAPKAPEKKSSPPKPKTPPPAAKQKNDNPWARKFGRLTVKELEKKIAQTEADIAARQAAMGNAQLPRDASRGRKLVEEHDALVKQLAELEKEYFGRQA